MFVCLFVFVLANNCDKWVINDSEYDISWDNDSFFIILSAYCTA